MTNVQTAVELMIARTVDIARQTLGNLMHLVTLLEESGKEVIVCDKRARSVHHSSTEVIRDWYSDRINTVNDGHLLNIAVMAKGKLPIVLTINLITGSISLANNGSSVNKDVLPAESTMRPALRDNGTPLNIDAYRLPMQRVILSNNNITPRSVFLISGGYREAASQPKGERMRMVYDQAVDSFVRSAAAERSLRGICGYSASKCTVDSIINTSIAGSLSTSRCLSGESEEIDDQLLAVIDYFCNRADDAVLEDLGRTALSIMADNKLSVIGKRVAFHRTYIYGVTVRSGGSVIQLRSVPPAQDALQRSELTPNVTQLWGIRKPSKAA